MSTSSTTEKNLSSLWYFAVIVLLTVAATIVLIVYNRSQQLTPEQLAAARQLWHEKGPRSYRLVYSEKISPQTGDPHTDRYEVTVRDSVVTAVTLNDRAECTEQFDTYGMEKLFDKLARNLDEDRETGHPKTFSRAIFHPVTGGLAWYVRRIMGSKQRVEITVELQKAEG